jgi:hypothetical protein
MTALGKHQQYSADTVSTAKAHPGTRLYGLMHRWYLETEEGLNRAYDLIVAPGLPGENGHPPAGQRSTTVCPSQFRAELTVIKAEIQNNRTERMKMDKALSELIGLCQRQTANLSCVTESVGRLAKTSSSASSKFQRDLPALTCECPIGRSQASSHTHGGWAAQRAGDPSPVRRE